MANQPPGYPPPPGGYGPQQPPGPPGPTWPQQGYGGQYPQQQPGYAPQPQGYLQRGYVPQAPPQSSSGWVIALVVVGVIAVLVVGGGFLVYGSGQTAVQRVVMSSFAPNYFKAHGPQILACFHPTGQYDKTGPVTVEGPDTASGSIYWKGGVLGKQYITTVSLHASDASERGPIVAELVGDTAVIPSVSHSCTLPR